MYPAATFLWMEHCYIAKCESSNTTRITAGTLTVSHSLGENSSVAAPAAAPRAHTDSADTMDVEA